MNMALLAYQLLARTLRAQGVDVVFGLLGDGNLYAMDSFVREEGGRFVKVAQESAGVLAAMGYHSMTGELGVATVTYGPAFSNTVTALIEASRAKTPLLLVAGETAPGDWQNLQNVDQRSIALAAEAGFVRATSADSLRADVQRAIARAFTERRPIVLVVPIALMWNEVADEQFTTAPITIPVAGGASRDLLEVAAGVLAAARRPVVVAGRGAISDEGRQAVLAFARRIGAPVATTLKARDLFTGEPENLGIFGGLATELATGIFTNADAVIAFGGRLNWYTTAEGSLTRDRIIIQVDADPHAIGQFTTPTVGIVGDAATVAAELQAVLDEAEIASTEFCSPAMIERIIDHGAQRAALTAARLLTPEVDAGPTGTVDLWSALARLDAVFAENRILVMDAGRFAPIAFGELQVRHPSRYVHAIHFGSIGLGMGAAIGASTARPDLPTLLITGDGGFMLGGLTEFNTAVREGSNLVVAVLNDGAYGAEHIQLRRKGMSTESSLIPWPDFAPVADALGGRGYTVRSLADLDRVIGELEHRDRPVLIDIKLDPEAVALGLDGPA